MTKQEVIEAINQYNSQVDFFFNVEVPSMIPEPNGHVTMQDWSDLIYLMENNELYKQGYALFKQCREQGFDVKMNLDTYKLFLCES